MNTRLILQLLLLIALPTSAYAQEQPAPEIKVVALKTSISDLTTTKPQPNYSRMEDVIYGRRAGMALTMDVFTPKGPRNGAGVILCVSAGFKSGRDMLDFMHPMFTTPFLDRGYTVFAVMHSSQPKFTVPDIVDDMHRAVRFINKRATQYGVAPDRIGIAGGSAGGHLSLMMGSAGTVGTTDSRDLVERESSKVAAVACFFPPTDFVALEKTCPKDFAASFDFRELDNRTGLLIPVSQEKRNQIGKQISPINHVTKNSVPTLIIHGDNDVLVPISQSQSMIAKLTDSGVNCKLITKTGKGHFWLGIEKDVVSCADWFDLHLLGTK